MNIELSENIKLHEINLNDIKHINLIKKLDNDELVKKYVIGAFSNFRELLSYYELYNDEMFNNVYFIEFNGEYVGTLEFDGDEKDLHINYSILNEYRQKNIGSLVLKSATNYLLKIVKKITLSIKKDNIASKRLALKIGYKRNNKSFLEYDNYEITN